MQLDRSCCVLGSSEKLKLSLTHPEVICMCGKQVLHSVEQNSLYEL